MPPVKRVFMRFLCLLGQPFFMQRIVKRNPCGFISHRANRFLYYMLLTFVKKVL